MKLFHALIILIFFQNCSFDNKSGIWKNENIKTKKNDDIFKEFKKISKSSDAFNKIIPVKKNFTFRINSPSSTSEWKDIFYNKNNNYNNFKYNDLNKKIYKSKKLSKHEVNDFLLFEDGNLIINDIKGNIITFSINENRIINKFNFYKKKYKKIKKSLNLIIENNIIYVSDNIGYLYAFNYRTNKILWAKNYKIPFGSNLKLTKNSIIASNQNNSLFFFNKKNGEILKLIPTEEVIVKNKFLNNLSLSQNTLFYLNTYGSLYSIDVKNFKINWFINLNQSIQVDVGNLFSAMPIVNNSSRIVISSNLSTFIIDSNTGEIITKKNFSASVRPIIQNNYVFLITEENLLISINLINGDIIYSYDINEQIGQFLKIKKDTAHFKSLMFANNKILIFLNNSYILNLENIGQLHKINKLPKSIKSQPIFISDSILYLTNKKKLIILD